MAARKNKEFFCEQQVKYCHTLCIFYFASIKDKK